MKKIFLIITLLTIFRSGLFAQSSPNGFDITLDKTVKELKTLPCGKEGFCIFTEKKTRKIHQFSLSHFDTLMKLRKEFQLDVPKERKLQEAFYENGAVVLLYRTYQNTRPTDQATLLLYRPDDGQLDSIAISGLPADESMAHWHHYQGNFTFVSISRRGERLWYLPTGTTQPFPFTFTVENPGSVLATAVDTAKGRSILCFSSGGRTMYFETDFLGQSSFANILNEPATHAQWIPVSRDHDVLMLYYHDDETFYMHPVNIQSHKVTPSESIYCANIATPKSLPAGVKEKHTIIIAPYSYISFHPSHATVEGDKLACITELYYAEYYNYFNGWYVEPRFNGYRYERADVHFFDTNGVFLTNVIFPYNEENSLHRNIFNKLNINTLEEDNILLYSYSGLELTTMLLAPDCKVKDPVRVSDLPLPGIPLQKHKTVIDLFAPWYSRNLFLFTSFRVNVASQQKVGYMVRRLEYR